MFVIRSEWRSCRTSASNIICVVLLSILLRLCYIDLTYPSQNQDFRLRTPKSQPSIFVILTAAKASNLNAVINSWLKEADISFLFIKNLHLNSKKFKYASFRYPHKQEWFTMRSEILYVDRFLPHHTDWYMFAYDDTYVLIDSLKYSIEDLNPDKKYFAVLGQSNSQRNGSYPVCLLSRAAFQFMTNRIKNGMDGCGTDGSIRDCLQVGAELELSRDSHNKSRSPTVSRHLVPDEMREHEQEHKVYDDGASTLASLSEDLLSLHGLSSGDIKIYDILLYRIRLWSINVTKEQTEKKK